jgi:hypothetical protein
MTRPGGIYDRMEEAGLGLILWAESITARPASSMEATTRLGLTPASLPRLRVWCWRGNLPTPTANLASCVSTSHSVRANGHPSHDFGWESNRSQKRACYSACS